MPFAITYFEAPITVQVLTLEAAMTAVRCLYPEAVFVPTVPPTEPAFWVYPSAAARASLDPEEVLDPDQSVAILRETATTAP